MNLPAVLLFICFSTAYGYRNCKSGMRIVHDGKSVMDGVTTAGASQCAVNTYGKSLCARLETTYSYDAKEFGKGSGESQIYFCGSGYRLQCADLRRSIHFLTPQMCSNYIDIPSVCQEDNKCYYVSIDVNSMASAKLQLCCSSDREFANVSSLYDTNWGLIIGIAVGAVALVILLIVAGVLVYIFCFKNKKQAPAGNGGKQKTWTGTGEAQKPLMPAPVARQPVMSVPVGQQAAKPSAYCG